MVPKPVPTVGLTDVTVGEPTNQKDDVMFAENDAVLNSILRKLGVSITTPDSGGTAHKNADNP